MSEVYTVASVRENGNAVRCEVMTPSGEIVRHRMTVKIWESFRLSKGDIISEEDYLKLSDISERCEAVTRAMKLLSESALSCKKLHEKLRRAGISDGAATDAVSVALKRGLIDEESQAEDYALTYARRNLRGRERVVATLVSHGYPTEIARRAASRVPSEIYAEALKKQLAKRCPGGIPEERHARELVVAAMIRQGFSAGEVLSAISSQER